MSCCFQIRILGAIIAFSTLLSCSVDSLSSLEKTDYSKEISQGEDIYITKSKAGGNGLVDLLPARATLSLEEMKDGRCELNIHYEFDEEGGLKHHSFEFVIPDVSVSDDGTKYSLSGNTLQGRWASKGIERSFDNVSVSGRIGYDGLGSLNLSGLAGGRDFKLQILETSGKYPGSQFDGTFAIIDYLVYTEVAVTNASSSACEVKFQRTELSISPQRELKLKSGESGTIAFWFEEDLWGSECAGLEIIYGGGKTVSIPAKDIAGLNTGSSFSVLKRNGTETTWYIREVDETSLIEPANYRTEVYEISDPE